MRQFFYVYSACIAMMVIIINSRYMHSRISVFRLCFLFFCFIIFASSAFARLQSEVEAFRVRPVPDSIFTLMQGRSYPQGCMVKRSDLRYVEVLHYDAQGRVKRGELVCHRSIAADLVSIFRELYKARYPIESMRLIDRYGADDERSMTANNTSAFNYRHIAGTSRLSNHSWGRAIDVNPLYNPLVARGGTVVQPRAGRRWANRSRKSPYRIVQGDLLYRLFRQHGFSWGGSWKKRKDYQHFEK